MLLADPTALKSLTPSLQLDRLATTRSHSSRVLLHLWQHSLKGHLKPIHGSKTHFKSERFHHRCTLPRSLGRQDFPSEYPCLQELGPSAFRMPDVYSVLRRAASSIVCRKRYGYYLYRTGSSVPGLWLHTPGVPTAETVGTSDDLGSLPAVFSGRQVH